MNGFAFCFLFFWSHLGITIFLTDAGCLADAKIDNLNASSSSEPEILFDDGSRDYIHDVTPKLPPDGAADEP